MELSARTVRQILLLSLVVLILPMIAFPERFGTSLASASFLNALLELFFYGLVTVFFYGRTSLTKLAQSAGVCFIYRLVLGACLGGLIALMYPDSMSLEIALSLAMSGYLPAILLHTAAAPFILRPVLRSIFEETPSRASRVAPALSREGPSRVDTPAGSGRTKSPATAAAGDRHWTTTVTAEVSPSALAPSREANGFERATSYIGEYASVLMAAVVDREGLLLSSFARGESRVEDWAPLSLLFLEDSQRILRRGGWQAPEKVALTLNDVRIIVTGDESFSLMVVAEREYDDVLSIRISQGLEIIRKYVAERYGDKLFVNAERTYA